LKNSARLALVLLALGLAGCPKRAQVQPTPPPDAETGLQQALDNIAARKFKLAQDELTFLIFNYPGSAHAADAQYYLAESYFLDQDYTQAQTEYDFYIKSFPNGRFQEEASLRLALSYLRSAPGSSKDQSRALHAQELVSEFLDTYPESNLRPQAESIQAEVDLRLADKELAAGRLYYKSGEYRAALVYFEYVRANHPLARLQGDDLLKLGICLEETGRAADARATLDEIIAGDYPEPVKQQARARQNRLH
jgi:outer membrane protein assembly factor BamD